MHQALQEFPSEVFDKLGYYVYRLIDPRNGDTFYVGKGQRNRVFDHIKGVAEEDDSDSLSLKMQIIHQIHNAGLEVIHVIHRHNLDKSTAKIVEAALIDCFPGLSNIQGGIGSNDFGRMNAQEIINLYAVKEAEISHKVMMITINRTIKEIPLDKAIRAAWKASMSRAKKAEYVLAVERGLIVEVFKPIEWKKALLDDFPEIGIDRPDRIGFIGDVAEKSIRDQYCNKRIPEKYRAPGAANPVKYSY